jgi:NADH-quinone oxidoreductase subunit I
MYGLGIAKGMWVTFTHFVDTYVQDAQYLFRSAKYRSSKLPERQGPKTARGLFTVEYPREKLQMTENLRIIPFLVYNSVTGQERCTSCGICAKVCPPQCIWIVRGSDPETKRPKPEPVEFTIDATICMSCGYCAEFCPFDAIKMDQNYEMGTYDRWNDLVLTKDKLMKPDTYHYQIHPSAKDAEAANIAKSEKAKNR